MDIYLKKTGELLIDGEQVFPLCTGYNFTGEKLLLEIALTEDNSFKVDTGDIVPKRITNQTISFSNPTVNTMLLSSNS